jgi:hypothetical protein
MDLVCSVFWAISLTVAVISSVMAAVIPIFMNDCSAVEATDLILELISSDAFETASDFPDVC